MLPEERRMLFKSSDYWYIKPIKAAYAIQVDNWQEGMKLVFGS